MACLTAKFRAIGGTTAKLTAVGGMKATISPVCGVDLWIYETLEDAEQPLLTADRRYILVRKQRRN